MSNIKVLALSEWLEYELEPNKILDPPKIRLRLQPGSNFTSVARELYAAEGILSEGLVSYVLEAIQDWDLTFKDKPLPCDAETKKKMRLTLRAILDIPLKGTKRLLGLELGDYAADPQNFLKN